jgi:hypothetical protein
VADTLINNQKALDDYVLHLQSQFNKHKAIKVSVKSAKVRTLTQNSSIHKYCEQLSDAFNDAGLDMETVLAKGTKIPWRMYTVKEFIWHTVMFPMTGKDSTTKLLTKEVGDIYEVVNRHISETFGVFVPWPCESTLMDKSMKDNYGS